MSNRVLDFIRRQDPRFNDVPDDALTLFIGREEPEFLKDPDFAELHGLRLQQKANLEAAGRARSAPAVLAETAKQVARWVLSPDEADPTVVKDREEQVHAFLKDRAADARAEAGQWWKAATTGDAAQWADAARHGIEQLPTTLIKAAGNVENAVGQVGRDYGRAISDQLGLEGAARTLVEETPAIAGQLLGTKGLAAVGAPAALAVGAPAYASARAEGEEPGRAAIAGLTAGMLPAVDQAGREVIAKAVSKELVDGTKILVNRMADGRLAAEVSRRFPWLSSVGVQRALEAGGGQLAANAFLATTRAPELMNSDDPGKDLAEGTIANLGLALTAAPEILGGKSSLSSEEALNRLRRGETIEVKRGRDDQAPPPPRQVTPEEPLPAPQVAPPQLPVPAQPPVEPAPVAQPPVEPAPVAQPPVEPAPVAQPPVEPPPVAQPPVEPPPVAQPPVEPPPVAQPPVEPAPLPAPAEPPVAPPDDNAPPPPPPPPEPEPEPEPEAGPKPGPPAAPPPANSQPAWLQGDFPGVVFGNQTVIAGANRQRFPAVYAWAPHDQLHASHFGSSFAPDPLYPPLVNTRDYSANHAEAEKVLDGARAFDPGMYVNNAPSASIGPVIVSRGSDGVLRVLGGNGRTQMTRFLRPEQQAEFDLVQGENAPVFGLGPRPRGAILVRLMGSHDVADPKSVEWARQAVDFLNPSDSRAEATTDMARNDAAKIPIGAIEAVDPSMTTPSLQGWFGKLMADGYLDRNTRSRIGQNESELRQYVNHLYLHAAHRRNDLVTASEAPAKVVPQTIKDLIGYAAKTNLQLRRLGEPKVADAISEMLGRMVHWQQQKGNVWHVRLVANQVASQIEGHDRTDKFVRGLARALANTVEMGTRNGKPIVDYDGTTDAWSDLFARFGKQLDAVAKGQGTGGLFGAPDTAFDVIEAAVRRLGPDVEEAMREEGEPYGATLEDDRSRFGELNKLRRRRPLTAQEQAEFAKLEIAFGQQMMFPEDSAAPAESAADRRKREVAALEAGLKRRLTGQNVFQQDLFSGPGDQLTLFEKAKQGELFPMPEPKLPANLPRKGPTRLITPLPPELQTELPGMEFGGASKGEPPPATRRALVQVRQSLMPPRPEGAPDYCAPFPWAKHLTVDQREGVNRVMDAWGRGDRFGLFDGTGAGKTRQELAVAAVAAAQWRKPVLVVTHNEPVIATSFANEAAALGLPIARYQGDVFLPGVSVYLSTYEDVGNGKVRPGMFNTLIWDEAHNLRNDADAARAKNGIAMDDAARHSLYATATPLDNPTQLAYLSKLYKRPLERVLADMGWTLETQVDTQGKVNRVYVPPPLEEHDPAKEAATLEKVFDEVYAGGRAIKREVPLDGVDVHLAFAPLDQTTQQDFKDFLDEMSDRYKHLGRMATPVIMMQGRRWLEGSKIPWVMDQVASALKRGRQPLVFGYQVNDGDTRGTLRALASMLEREHGVGSVAKLFGGGSSASDRRFFQQEVKRFQTGAAKIGIGNPQQAGTGVSLDDVYGDAPRTLILLTPPFSALELTQIVGRVNRLATRSRPEMMIPFSGHYVDRWGLDIIRQKLSALHAAVKGDSADITDEPGTQKPSAGESTFEDSTVEAKRRKYKDPRQTEFDFLQAAYAAGSAQGAGAKPDFIGGSGRGLAPITKSGGVRLVPASVVVAQQALTDGEVAAVGLPARTPEDVAAIAQWWRNAAVEVARWVLVRDGKVVQVISYTLGKPGSVDLLPRAKEGESKPADDILESIRRTGADGFYVVHNHPSGNPGPSEADLRITGVLSGIRAPVSASSLHQIAGVLAPLFRGHIITDHDRYTNIRPDGTHEILPTRASGPDPLVRRTGESNRTPTETDAIVERYAGKHEGPVVLLSNSRHFLRGVALLDESQLGNPEVHQDLARLARAHGAPVVTLYSYLRTPAVQQIVNAARGNGGRTNVFTHVVTGGGVINELPAQMTEAPIPDVWTIAREESQGTSPIQLQLPGVASPEAIRLGGLEVVKPLEMPEMVRLARELMGAFPRVKVIQQPGLKGYFKPRGARSHIAIDARVFVNPKEAAAVLAHELGHLTDYLPDHTLKRGNLLGRLLTLRRFMRETLPGVLARNKEVRDELVALTHWWRPFDPALVTPHFKAYRYSAEELYADALSVVFNSPKSLLDRAPKFYHEFFAHLDRKPAVYDAFWGLQQLLEQGRLTTYEVRQQEIRGMFQKGEERMAEVAAEREARRKSWRGWWMSMQQSLVDRAQPVRAKQLEAERSRPASATTPLGVSSLPRSVDAREAIERSNMVDVDNLRLARRIHETVVQPLEAAGLSIEDLGEFQFAQRILAGDREALANPLGHTPETARAVGLQLRRAVGLDGWQALQRADEAMRRAIWPVFEDANRAGMYDPRTWRGLVANKDAYAAFAVLDYLSDYIPAGIKRQIGTFKEIANPFAATVLKTISLQRALAAQKARAATLGLLVQYFPAEVKPLRFGAKPGPDRGVLSVWQAGTLQDFEVDKSIAESFERPDFAPACWPLLRPFDWAFRHLVYPLIIKYNPGFGLFLSPMRDIQRTDRNLKAATGAVGLGRVAKSFQLAVAMAQSLPDSAGRTSGHASPLVREMEANRALQTPFDTFANLHRDDAIGRLLRRYKLAAEPAPTSRLGALGHAVATPLRAIEWASITLDTLPKLAAYRVLRNDGWHPRDAAIVIRNFAGLPNISRKGADATTVRALVPFWNVFIQGARADFPLFTEPKTAGGMWFRYATGGGFLKTMMALGAVGAFGAAIKSLFDGVSEYDKSNYLVIPMGFQPGGEFGQKTVYLRVAQDDSDRLMNGLLYKAIHQLASTNGLDKLPTDLFDFSASQLPTFTPGLTIAKNWMEYADGVDPTDPFHNRAIVPRIPFLARSSGPEALEAMGRWTLDQVGLGNLVHWDPAADNFTQLTLSAIPGVNRLLKISDYGHREVQDAQGGAEAAAVARHRMEYSPEVQSLLGEYGRLKSIKGADLTPQQSQRLLTLSTWRDSIFKPLDEQVWNSETNNAPKDAKDLRGVVDQIARGLDLVKGKTNSPPIHFGLPK